MRRDGSEHTTHADGVDVVVWGRAALLYCCDAAAGGVAPGDVVFLRVRCMKLKTFNGVAELAVQQAPLAEKFPS